MNLPTKPTPAQSKEDMKKAQPFATHEIFLTRKQVDEFKNLVDRSASETTIHNYLIENPEILTAALHKFGTGNHAAIVIPKQELRPRLKLEGDKGLIPDFLIGGKNSDGWNWWIVELKGPAQTIFSQSDAETYFSTEINKGICQLLEYIDYASEQQAALRDAFKLEGIREPNGLILAGREAEIMADQRKQKLKAAWNRREQGRLEIRTYDFIIRNLHSLADIHDKLNK